MKVSVSWLKDYVDITCPISELAEIVLAGAHGLSGASSATMREFNHWGAIR
jgi:hypothetical protein